jgi:ABC-type transport system involved in cytochrome bd biosynthesis fused ATPase/permease subunit
LAEELTDGPKFLTNVDPSEPALEITNASFEWDEPVANLTIEDSTDSKSPEKENTENKKEEGTGIFRLTDVNLKIQRGSLVAIIGSVGSGKSSFLQALVGEMRRTSGSITLRSSDTKLGWCPQAACIFNATVRENILFGQPYDEKKYREIVKKCALESDFKILPAGDQTEIGEKGINLSGGQKQRVSLARALYFGAEIVLLVSKCYTPASDNAPN